MLVLDVGADLGLESGQNLVVRRRFLGRRSHQPAVRASAGQQSAGLIQVVEAGVDTSVAVVVYACGELFAGDTVEPFDALPMWTAQGLRTPQYDDPAKVILGDHGQTLGAPRQLMVIDRGAEQGAERGQRTHDLPALARRPRPGRLDCRRDHRRRAAGIGHHPHRAGQRRGDGRRSGGAAPLRQG